MVDFDSIWCIQEKWNRLSQQQQGDWGVDEIDLRWLMEGTKIVLLPYRNTFLPLTQTPWYSKSSPIPRHNKTTTGLFEVPKETLQYTWILLASLYKQWMMSYDPTLYSSDHWSWPNHKKLTLGSSGPCELDETLCPSQDVWKYCGVHVA